MQELLNPKAAFKDRILETHLPIFQSNQTDTRCYKQKFRSFSNNNDSGRGSFVDSSLWCWVILYFHPITVWNCFLVIIWSLVFQPICVKYMRTLKGNVLYIPHQLKSSESYSVISLAEATGEATEDMNENAPLMTAGRLRSTGDSNMVDNISYGSVITV